MKNLILWVLIWYVVTNKYRDWQFANLLKQVPKIVYKGKNKL